MRVLSQAVGLAAVVTLAACDSAAPERQHEPTAHQRSATAAPEAYVVIATLDTGTNLLHSSWQRAHSAHPSGYIPGYPATARALEISYTGSYMDRLSSSSEALESLYEHDWPLWVPGTNLIGLWAARETDIAPVFDVASFASGAEAHHTHGAQASSQIAATGYGMAEDAFLVIMDYRTEIASDTSEESYANVRDGLIWAAEQSWIDIIHTNVQNFVPLAGRHTDGLPYDGYHEAVQYAIDKGKLVISAGGNFYALPTETSPHTGPVGVLIAGANDNCGYTDFSNPNPHVVMDGSRTESAAPKDDGSAAFNGTSSASPRVTGYAGQLLLELRRAVDDRHGFRDGHLIVIDDPARVPAEGPLADGRLHAAEMHEIIRKTANPNPHASRFDGGQYLNCIPQPLESPVAAYPKMGYGEVSEHTLPLALDVALGRAPMPERPIEDRLFEQSRALRERIWE